VFAWHGLGGSGELASRYFGVERAADGGAIFVYPDGLPDADGNAAWDLAPDGPDIQFFDALLASVAGDYCVDSARVFSAGHSFGAYFTNRLACTRGDLLRGIAPFGGGGECDVAVAAWVAHGSNDETVDFAQGEQARDLWSGNAGCGTTSTATSPEPCVAIDGCPADLPVHWCVHEEGHNWPMFAGEGVWAFFAAL
jgi:poly(3-hydroxybutyrate) depolymerase